VGLISRGFQRRREVEASADRVPPGQYVTSDFPVLSAGPTPRISTEEWRFRVTSEQGEETTWSWEEFSALPSELVKVDIHCVTKWSKLDTEWRGVSVDIILQNVDTSALFVTAHCYGGYTTNLPLADLTDGKGWIVIEYDGQSLAPEHGGPARLLVPHLYFWKSAKWIHRLELRENDLPGFWESLGYHIYGDPWKEQRYAGD
jgi:DMSO/TMAO reductase YedYZ molybdopterin-dependent catalytic subunit